MSFILAATGLLLALSLFIIVYMKWHEYKTKKIFHTRDGKSIRGPSIFAGFAALIKKLNFITIQHTNQQHYGNLYCSFLGTLPMLSCSDAEVAKKLFLEHKHFTKTDLFYNSFSNAFLGRNIVSTNGEEWRKVRMIMNPAFAKLDDVLLDKFVMKTREVLDSIEKRRNTLPNGIDVVPEMQRMTLDIIGLAAFNYDFGAVTNPVNRSKEVDAYHFLFEFSLSFWHILFPNFISWPLPVNTKAKKYLKLYNDLILDMVHKAKERMESEDQTPSCLLDLMCSHVDEETKQGLSIEELRANTVVLFIAGHETTANSLSAAFYVLAKQPAIQERLYQEIMKHTGHITSDSLLNCDAVNNMEYLNNFIKENLRMYPPIISIPLRTSQSDTVLDGFTVPKGTNINIHVHNIHHDERYWKDPYTFNPDRFLPENSQGRPFYSFIPFGGAARSCIGNNFSYLEQRVFLTMLLREYKVELTDPKYELELFTPVLLASPQNVRIKFTRRRNK